MFKTIGFTGTRHAHLVPAGLAGVVHRLSHLPGLVGCAAGADQVVRQQHPAAQVFTSQGPRGWQFALRSISMVQALAASPSPALVVAPGAPCPASVTPSASSGACFNGSGSGTWATAAYAAGLGVAVFAIGQCAGHWPGHWQVVRSGLFIGLHRYYPAPKSAQLSQLSLF